MIHQRKFNKQDAWILKFQMWCRKIETKLFLKNDPVNQKKKQNLIKQTTVANNIILETKKLSFKQKMKYTHTLTNGQKWKYPYTHRKTSKEKRIQQEKRGCFLFVCSYKFCFNEWLWCDFFDHDDDDDNGHSLSFSVKLPIDEWIQFLKHGFSFSRTIHARQHTSGLFSFRFLISKIVHVPPLFDR